MSVVRFWKDRVFIVALVLTFPSAIPVSAQTSSPAPDPNPGRLTLTASVNVVSTYMFRGIRQNATGVAFWPVADVGVALYSGDDALKGATLNLGSWNSLNTGDTRG